MKTQNIHTNKISYKSIETERRGLGIVNIHNFNIKGYEEVVKETLALSIKKNNAYGKKNISVLGGRGIFVRIWDKVSRLKTLVWDRTGEDEVDETIRDTYIDIINYAIYGVMLIDKTWGKDNELD